MLGSFLFSEESLCLLFSHCDGEEPVFFNHVKNEKFEGITEEDSMIFNGVDFDTYYRNYPDKNGYYGRYGGGYVEEKLKKFLEQ